MADVVKESKIQAFQKNLVRFFKEVRSELKKVIWPTREQLIKNTITVLLACFVVGAIIWVFDLGLAQISTMVFTK